MVLSNVDASRILRSRYLNQMTNISYRGRHDIGRDMERSGKLLVSSFHYGQDSAVDRRGKEIRMGTQCEVALMRSST